MPERLLNQMKKLAGIEASQEWQKQTRSFLVNKVNQDTLTNNHRASWNYSLKVFIMDWQDRLVPSPAKIVYFLLLIGLVSGTGIAARAEYNPSKFLYSVWETVERAELVLATTPASQTKIYLKHVEKGVNDAKKLAKSDKLANEEKGKQINTVVTKLKKELTAASVSLDIADQTQNNEAGITDLAKEVTQNTKDTAVALNQVIEDSLIQGIDKEAVDKAIATTEVVESDAIKLLLNQQNIESLSESEIKNLVVDKIARTTEKIGQILGYLSPVGEPLQEPFLNPAETTSQNTTIEPANLETAPEPALDSKTIEELNQMAAESQEYLDLASNFLEENNIIEALKNIESCNQKISQINGKLGNIIINQQEATDGDNAEIQTGLQVEGAIEILGSEADATTTTETTTAVINGN